MIRSRCFAIYSTKRTPNEGKELLIWESFLELTESAGVVNAGLDAKLAYQVGLAAAAVLAEETGKSRPLFAIGKDTRISSDLLEGALIAGLCSAGADVLHLGVIPTPAVAFVTVDAGADAGVVISASHNPFEHNGNQNLQRKRLQAL